MTDAASIDGSVNAGATASSGRRFVRRHPIEDVRNPLNAVLSVASLGGLLWILPGLLRWLVIDAAFLPAEPRTCQAAAGACWSVRRQIIWDNPGGFRREALAHQG